MGKLKVDYLGEEEGILTRHDIHDFRKLVLGQKVTKYVYGDKYPATVVAIRKNGREVDIQVDSSTDTALEEQSICFIKSDNVIGNYIIERDHTGVISTWTLRSNNRYVSKGTHFKRAHFLYHHLYERYDTTYGR